jgi:hypothetical protein
MREGSLNRFSTTDPERGTESKRKSLFWNILAVSPCGSRFYADRALSVTHKFLGMNILAKPEKKIVRDISGRTPNLPRNSGAN